MKIKSYFEKSGLTLQQVGDQSHPRMIKSQAHHVINNPWRVSLEFFLAAARVVGMPDAEARDEWAEARTKESRRRIYKEARG
jgi:hypothetical protein